MMNKKNLIINIIIIMLSIINYLLLIKTNLFVINIILLLTQFILLIKNYKEDKRLFIYTIIFSFILSFTQIVGYNCYNYDTAKLNQLNTYLKIITLIPIIFTISKYLYTLNKIKIKDNKYISKLFDSKYSFIIITLLIFIAYIPILIAFYPGNFSYDAGTQLRMIKFNMITKYHPVIHTIFLYLTIILGNNLFASYDIGLLLHSIFQMIIMSSIFSYTLCYLNKKKFPNILNFILLIIYMFLPLHSMFSITTTKDIIFSALFNLATIKLIELSINTDNFLKDKKEVISTTIIFFLLLSFRNNMLYSLILAIPFILFILRKNFKKVLILFISIIAIFKIYDITLTKIFKIENGPRVEMFSFVVQQFARVYNNDELTDEEKSDIEILYNNNSLVNYNSHISDPVKSEFNSNELLSNKSKYLKLYITLLLKYPNTFVDSILDNIYSFFYIGDKLPDYGTKTYIEINCLDTSNDTFDRSLNCKNDNFIQRSYFDLLHNATYQNIPILNILMNMSIYIILLFFVGIFLLTKKEYKLFIPVLLLISYFATNILAPVAIIRYVYPIITSSPILIYLYYDNLKTKNKKKK